MALKGFDIVKLNKEQKKIILPSF